MGINNSPLVSATHTPPTLQALEALVESCPEDEVRDLGLLLGGLQIGMAPGEDHSNPFGALFPKQEVTM